MNPRWTWMSAKSLTLRQLWNTSRRTCQWGRRGSMASSTMLGWVVAMIVAMIQSMIVAMVVAIKIVMIVAMIVALRIVHLWIAHQLAFLRWAMQFWALWLGFLDDGNEECDDPFLEGYHQFHFTFRQVCVCGEFDWQTWGQVIRRLFPSDHIHIFPSVARLRGKWMWTWWGRWGWQNFACHF